MWLIAGLGNPGSKYHGTRHNLGFMVLDRLALKAGIQKSKLFKKAEIGRGRVGSQEAVLAKPQTFMNLSGVSVAALARHWRLKAEDLIVIHDDLDLGLGRLKLVSGGGAGGHKGVASIIEHLGNPGFIRLRVGIGRPEPQNEEVERFVLQRFRPEEQKVVDPVIERSVEAIEAVVARGILQAQTEFNCHK